MNLEKRLKILPSDPGRPLVSIVIYNYRHGALAACLEHIFSQPLLLNFEVIIIDNGSSDDATSGLNEKYPSLNLNIRRLESNQGFAAANNLGAGLARGEWLALLNADAFPQPDWLEKLLLAARQHP